MLHQITPVRNTLCTTKKNNIPVVVTLSKQGSIPNPNMVGVLKIAVAMGPRTLKFLKDLGRRLSPVVNSNLSCAHLVQRLSVALQWGNAASVLGSTLLSLLIARTKFSEFSDAVNKR